METLPSYKVIWKISYPIILSLVAQNIINVIDTAFLGRVGEVELGASALAGLFYISLFMLGFGFSTGAQILIARRHGEGNYKDIGNIFDQSLYFLIGLALVLFLFIKMFSTGILGRFISSEAIFQACTRFLQYRIWGLFFAFTNVIFRAFYIGITRTKVLTVSAVIMAAVNILLDYVLIFGHWGFPQMGIAGAALASVIAEASSALFFIIITARNKKLKSYNLGQFPWPSIKLVRKTLEISSFIMAQFFISLGGWFVFFMIIEKMGERSLAVSNIIRSAYMVLMLPIWALGSTTSSLVSNALGAGHPELVLPLIRRITKVGIAMMLVVVSISVIFPKMIISIYTSNAGLIQDTIPPLYVVMGALILFSMTQIMFSGVSGTANTNISMLIEIITICIYLFATWLIAIHFKQPITVVWCCEYVYFLSLGLMSFAYLRWGKWRLKVV